MNFVSIMKYSALFNIKQFLCRSIILFLNLFYLEAYMIHQKFPIEHVWKEENLEPFDELILSWNGMRPLGGSFLFYVRVKTAHWSP